MTPISEATPGRPRDPEVEQRALATALEIFSTKGWFGFTIGAVAQQARVGKSSIYLRWGSREQLLTAAFDEYEVSLPERLPAGSLRERLVEHLARRGETYFSLVGLAIMRLQVEYQANPDLFADLWSATVGRFIARQQELLAAARDRGELSPDTPVDVLAEALEGAVLIHAASTPVPARHAAALDFAPWAETLVAAMVDPWLTASGRGAELHRV